MARIDPVDVAEPLAGCVYDMASELDRWDKLHAIDRILDQIGANDRQRAVFRGRLEGATLDELGEEHGVTRERIRQLYCKTERRVMAILRQRRVIGEVPSLRRAPERTLYRPVPIAPVQYRDVEYIDLFPAATSWEITTPFDTVDDVRSQIKGRGMVAADVDGRWTMVTPFGWTDRPEDCAMFDGTNLVVLFKEGGRRFGEDWRCLRKVERPRFSFRTVSKAVH